MKKIILAFLMCVTLPVFAQVSSVTINANGDVLNGKIVNFASGKLTVNGVQITGVTPDASTTVKGLVKLSTAPVSSSNPIAVGDNDSRMTNARTPTAHASTHASGGTDPVTLIISQITGLQSALDLKAPLDSPALTGVPLAPTAAVDTSTTQIATTNFVLAQAASATPIVAGTGTVGASSRYARGDHIHPAQTSVTGNAGTATALQTARTINGVSFDGTTNVTVTAAAGTLTGTTLASNVTASSLLSASGGAFGSNAFNSTAYQPLDGDLTSLAGAASTDKVYYRSAADTWDIANMGSTGLSFTGGTFIIDGSAIPGLPSQVSNTAFASSWDTVTTIAASKNATYDYLHTFDTDDDGKVNVLDQVAGIPLTDANGVLLSPITDNSSNWNTAYTDRLKWDGGATGLVPATGRTSLELGTLATQSGTFSGTSSGTNTGDQNSIVGITGTTAQFNTALTDANFATGGGTATGTNTGDQTSVTGNAGTATALQNTRTIGGISFDGTANIVPQTVTIVDSTDATSFPLIVDSATGDLQPKTDGGLLYNASTGLLTATGFSGPLTGNVTGNTSGTSGSTTGNAATATALQNSRNINGVAFDGTGNITVTAAAGTITGATLASGVTASSLTSLGTQANDLVFTSAKGISFISGGTSGNYGISFINEGVKLPLRVALDYDATTHRYFQVGYYSNNTTGGTWNTAFEVDGYSGNATFKGAAAFNGTGTNNNAAAGQVGEYVSSSVVQGSAVALTTGTAKTVTSISLTAGDWDVTAIGALTGASTGTVFDVAISVNNNSLTGSVLGDTRCQTPTVSLTGADTSLMIPAVRVSIASTTTYYLIVQELFTIGSPAAYGRISARRVR